VRAEPRQCAPGTVTLVFGTRPEIIKLAPVAWALAERGVPCVHVSSGQHPDLIGPLARDLGVPIDVDLGVGTPPRDPSAMVEAILGRLRGVLAAVHPSVVVVQGDTTTAFAAALAAFYAGIGIAHVEAGLRTARLHEPWPEEAHRRLVGRIADLHLAPTAANRAALLAEGIDACAIEVVGNPVVDALQAVLARRRPRIAEPPPFDRPIVVTLHRREGQPHLRRRLEVLRDHLDADPEAAIVFPVHPAPAVRATAEAVLGRHPRARLVGPMRYPAFVELLDRAQLVVTDSGGIQEEAPALGTPLVVVREVTERPEILSGGHARLAGTPEALAEALRTPWPRRGPTSPFGDGRAAVRIVAALARRWPLAQPQPVVVPQS